MWRDVMQSSKYSNMAPTPGEDGVAKEHAAAVTRNYISQPRLSELFYTPSGMKLPNYIACSVITRP